MDRRDSYRILLDKKWSLEDLYKFPRAFAQTYAFAYCFETELPTNDFNRINEALETYPWLGGYSYVNIYTVLQRNVPIKDRPRINSIQYASPGWLDLLLNLETAKRIAEAVGAISGSLAATVASYAAIQKCLHDIKVDREKSKVEYYRASKDQIKELRGLSEELAKLTKFKKFGELVERTGDEEVAPKLISAQYRRLKKIAEYSLNGKASLPILTKLDK